MNTLGKLTSGPLTKQQVRTFLKTLNFADIEFSIKQTKIRGYTRMHGTGVSIKFNEINDEWFVSINDV
jgi:hypothetical protein